MYYTTSQSSDYCKIWARIDAHSLIDVSKQDKAMQVILLINTRQWSWYHLLHSFLTVEHYPNPGFCTASIALFTELQIVFEMISIGTLLVFYLVANALIYHRYAKLGTNRPFHVRLFLILLTMSSLGFSLSRRIDGRCRWGMALFGAISIALTTVFHYTARQDMAASPSEWTVPLMPWPAAASVFLNVFLMTTLKVRSLQRFGIWSLVIIIFYVCYGVHSTYTAEENEIVNAMIHHANMDIS